MVFTENRSLSRYINAYIQGKRNDAFARVGVVGPVIAG